MRHNHFIYCILTVFLLAFVFAQAQQVNKYITERELSTEWRKNLRIQIPAKTADVINEQNQKIKLSGRKIQMMNLSQNHNPACGTCHEMGVENGWNFWQAESGSNIDSFGLSFNGVFPPSANRFNITSGNGIDPLTPGLNPGDPPITVVGPPGFGAHSIQLGELQTDGIGGGCRTQDTLAGCAERLTYCFTVGQNDTNFIYAYAFLMENPEDTGRNAHTLENMPYVEFMILDANGDTIPCAYQRYIADSNLPGLYKCNSARFDNFGARDTATYKPWSVEGVNLTPYIGQIVTVIITNADCQIGGHFAHSYWDFSCGTTSGITVPTCYTNYPDTLIAPAAPDNNPRSYVWFKNNDPNPVGYTQTITPYTLNGDTFTVKVINTSGCYFYARYVPQHFSISIDFTASAVCETGLISDISTSSSSTDPITQWIWNFPNGIPATSNQQEPGNVTLPAGTSQITLIAGTVGAGCRDTVSHPLFIPGKPQADFTPLRACTNTSLQTDNLTSLSPTDTLSGYLWLFPGGSPSSSSIEEPEVNFSSSGTFDVMLIASTTRGCTDTALKQFIIYDRPNASFTATPVCFGDSIKLINQSTASNSSDTLFYNWSLPGSSIGNSTDTNPSVFYPSPGSSSVTLTVTSSSGCIDTLQGNVVVNPVPLTDFTAPQFCSGVTQALQNNSSILSIDSILTFQWIIPDVTISSNSITNPSVTFSQPDTTLATLIATSQFGCIDTVEKILIATPQPTASFTIPAVCFSEQSTVNNLSFSNPIGENLTYQWIAPSAIPSNTSDVQPTFFFNQPGNYNIELVAIAPGGCRDTMIQNAVIHPNPIASFTVPTLCLGSNVAFTNTSDPGDAQGTTYQWNFTNARPTTSSLYSPVVTFDTSGGQSVQLIVTTSSGCSDTVSSSVLVYAPPVAQITAGSSGCVPVCHVFADSSLNGDGIITEWNWSFVGAEPSFSIDQNPQQICYNQPGNYDVILNILSSTGCRSRLEARNVIAAYDYPTADFNITNQDGSLYSPRFTFDDLSTRDVTSWYWDFGDGIVDTSGPNVSHNYSSSLTSNDFYQFTSTLIVKNQFGCPDTILKQLKIDPEYIIYFPNSFTPNGDGDNDTFYGKGIGIKEYDITILDRWGKEIWDCHYEGSNIPWDKYAEEGMSSGCRWDGKVNGNIVQQDVYVWKANVLDVYDKKHTAIGHVTVVH